MQSICNLNSKKMKELMHLNNKQLKWHIIFWILIIANLNFTDPLPGTWMAKIIGSALINLNYMFVFYSISLYIFPKFFKIKFILLVISIIVCLLIFWCNYYIIACKLINKLGGSTYYQQATFYYFLNRTFYYFIIDSSAGIASFYARYSLFKLKQQKENENSFLIRELNLLKTQFNAHNTFEFLNYCYNETKEKFPELSKSIALFSDMLRYTIQIKPEEKVLLNDEISYIENFIILQRLLSARVYVDLKSEGQVNNVTILPRILITFVENAFKHGICNDPEFPIIINLQTKSNILTFSVENKIHHNKSIASSHTGLNNVTQILSLFYADKHELSFIEKDEFYYVRLIITLDEKVN